MNKFIYIIFALTSSIATVQASDYKTTVDRWTSHEDVAEWMKSDWHFDHNLAQNMARIISRDGPSAATIKSPEETFDNPRGWCKDAASFSKDTLNTIDPEYKAAYIFIKNRIGPPNHWVTGFRYDGKLYVMDYGAGSEWQEMMGLHGPYDSIDEYGEFLATVDARNFEFEFVTWSRPGEQSGSDHASSIRTKTILSKFDRNSDNRLSFNEAPNPMKKNFKRLDVNEDEYLDEKELNSLPPR